LLDPNLSFQDAVSKHVAYTTESPGQLFITAAPTDLPKLLQIDNWSKSERRKYLNHMISEYPIAQNFIPSTEVIHKLILKSSKITQDRDILYQINPKERKRLNRENDPSEDIFEPIRQIKVRPKQIKYPNLVNPDFYKQTSLKYL
jgi:hypothetical protein